MPTGKIPATFGSVNCIWHLEMHVLGSRWLDRKLEGLEKR